MTRPAASGMQNIQAEHAPIPNTTTNAMKSKMDFSINNEFNSTFNNGSRLGVPGSAATENRIKSPAKILMPPKSPIPPKTGYGGMRSGSKSNLLPFSQPDN